MSIDIAVERVDTLGRLARDLPTPRGRRGVHASTLYRWSREGLQGERLECIRVGGSLCSSKEALQRFFDRLTGPGRTIEAPAVRAKQRSLDDVAARLRGLGI